MITFDSIKKEQPGMSDGNISAFLKFAKMFNCLDAKSFEDADKHIKSSMQKISDDMAAAPEEEQGDIFLRGFAGLTE